jgi:hypothetical protein
MENHRAKIKFATRSVKKKRKEKKNLPIGAHRSLTEKGQ